MDWQHRIAQWLQRPRSIAFVIAAIAVAALVAMQTNAFKTKQPQMCELISQCQLRHGDLQRIQVALGESGLNDFAIDGQQLLVPKQRYAEYLKAVSERNALPMDLREEHSNPVANPLLSRSQQQALKWQQKKRQLKEMILRLPFVQQAWLEIDTAPASSLFEPAKQSAVISIQPADQCALQTQHVDTLRRMVSGAVAGLKPEQIEVIDLGQGFAFNEPGLYQARDAVAFDRVLCSKEQELESRISSALKRFEGVSVNVELTPLGTKQRATSSSNVKPILQNESLVKPLVAGSNGSASIFEYDRSRNPAATCQVSQVHTVEATASERTCRVAVQVEVPESALESVAMPLVLRYPSEIDSAKTVDRITQKFDAIRPRIEREVVSLLSEDWLQSPEQTPVQVTLVRTPVSKSPDQRAQLSQLFQKYWPSFATLFVGCTLLSLVARKSLARHQPANFGLTTLSVSQSGENLDDSSKTAKETINRMFKNDPDGAAQVIEGWIRNAG